MVNTLMYIAIVSMCNEAIIVIVIILHEYYRIILLCVCLRMFIYVCLYLRVCMYLRMYVFMCVFTCVCIYVYVTGFDKSHLLLIQ